MHEDHVPVFLRYCQVMTLRIDLGILTAEQVMTSSVVVPSAVYLNKKNLVKYKKNLQNLTSDFLSKAGFCAL